MKLSKWWDKDTPPVHKGVYQVSVDFGYGVICDRYSFWDGRIFNGCWSDILMAYRQGDFGCGNTPIKWRGVLK